MLSIALFISALGACVLPDDVDPNNKCVQDANGFSTLDADSDDAIPMSLEISTKFATIDAFRVTHPATVGALVDDTATDGRYILACPQVAGSKTVGLNITRPASLTAFGAEWVQLFPKDSWENKTNEFEPFSFNDYGSKIPLAEFRPIPTGDVEEDRWLHTSLDQTSLDAPTKDVLNVFMEIKDEGDYEIKFGNPYLTSNGGKWVAVEFKQTLLRVGTPWADCSGDALGDASYSVGAIMPVLFGHPNLHTITLKPGFPSYDDVIAELSGVSVPVKVVLEIFTETKTTYTTSANGAVCYRAGNACPENHVVCKPEFCEMEVWAKIIADFKAASPGKVTVLGAVGVGTSVSAYSALDLDGFYFVGVDVEAGYTGTSVAAIGSPLFDESTVNTADVFVTLASSNLGMWNPFSWYPYVSPSKWAAIVTEATDPASDIAALMDRGYGWIFLTSAEDFTTRSTINEEVLDTLEATSAGRRLQDRRLQVSFPFWGCDDTLLQCTPICIKQMGISATKAAENLCTAAPMDLCACPCYHSAQWTCEGQSMVCKAKFGAGSLETVGDKVCEMRGAPKPVSDSDLSAVESRVTAECEPITEMRGYQPPAECLTQWAASSVSATDPPAQPSGSPGAESTASPEQPPATGLITEESAESLSSASTATPAAATAGPSSTTLEPSSPTPESLPPPIIMAESFASVLAVATIAAYA